MLYLSLFKILTIEFPEVEKYCTLYWKTIPIYAVAWLKTPAFWSIQFLRIAFWRLKKTALVCGLVRRRHIWIESGKSRNRRRKRRTQPWRLSNVWKRLPDDNGKRSEYVGTRFLLPTFNLCEQFLSVFWPYIHKPSAGFTARKYEGWALPFQGQGPFENWGYQMHPTWEDIMPFAHHGSKRYRKDEITGIILNFLQ